MRPRGEIRMLLRAGFAERGACTWREMLPCAQVDTRSPAEVRLVRKTVENMVAAAVLFGIGGQTWSDDIKTLLVTAIVTGALGSITGFFLGSSLGSQRKNVGVCVGLPTRLQEKTQ